MGLGISNLLGVVNGVSTGFGSSQSLKKFISTMDNVGIQITSRYEAVFSGIPQATFFIQSINTPGMKQNITQLHFGGKMVEIPQNYEYDHDFTMTVINDASGYIYSALTTFVMGDTASNMVNNGYSMSIKAIGDNNHSGSTIFLNGVRIKSIDGISFANQGGDIQTFNVGCSAIDFSVTPGSSRQIAGISNAVASLIR